MPQKTVANPLAKIETTDLSTADLAHRHEIIRRANAGDTATRPLLQEIFDICSDGIVPPEAQAAHITEDRFLRNAYESVIHGEYARREAVNLRAELEGKNPTPLERLLVERVSICWLMLNFTEQVYAHQVTTANAKTLKFYQDRMEWAQRRFLAAVKALTQVRRLQIPVVQVNIGEKQINVVGMSEQAE